MQLSIGAKVISFRNEKFHRLSQLGVSSVNPSASACLDIPRPQMGDKITRQHVKTVTHGSSSPGTSQHWAAGSRWTFGCSSGDLQRSLQLASTPGTCTKNWLGVGGKRTKWSQTTAGLRHRSAAMISSRFRSIFACWSDEVCLWMERWWRPFDRARCFIVVHTFVLW